MRAQGDSVTARQAELVSIDRGDSPAPYLRVSFLVKQSE
jgi:hypothetical protein